MAVVLALFAILLWSFLAYFAARFTGISSLLIVGLALCISGAVGAMRWREWRVPLRTMAVGVGGIFGYHFLYFSAFQRAPAVEVNLMNYLWPLLIVVLSPLLLQGYSLQPHHLVGAFMGLIGAFLIVGGGRLRLETIYVEGYLLAAAAAVVWATYSLLTKRLPPFPNGAVGAFCLVSGLLALGVEALRGGLNADGLTVANWPSLLVLGLGPMGMAFFAWDAALKRGDPRVIGSLAYLAPLLSTLNLVLLSGKHINRAAAVAMILIVGGAIVGSLDQWKPRPKKSSMVVIEGQLTETEVQ